eukprot:TRINITY_DN1573_c0_g1_i1.p1 TRINITY_DN1573_c0_g1~~TRINITY_DN1573_c0_g1_i1.p1  ORF type:complete len:913 (+),score=98.33 TRINITY_DN1573_c0_g1_i1:542-3280(+)
MNLVGSLLNRELFGTPAGRNQQSNLDSHLLPFQARVTRTMTFDYDAHGLPLVCKFFRPLLGRSSVPADRPFCVLRSSTTPSSTRMTLRKRKRSVEHIVTSGDCPDVDSKAVEDRGGAGQQLLAIADENGQVQIFDSCPFGRGQAPPRPSLPARAQPIWTSSHMYSENDREDVDEFEASPDSHSNSQRHAPRTRRRRSSSRGDLHRRGDPDDNDEIMRCVWRVDAHKDAIFDLAWSSTGSHFLTGAGDYSVALWDLSAETKTRTFDGHVGSVKSIAYQHRRDDLFCSGARDGNIVLWDVRCGNPGVTVRSQGSLPIPSGPVISNAHCPKYLTSERSLYRKRMKPPLDSMVDWGQSVTSVVWLHDNNVLVTAGAADGLVKFWDMRGGSHLGRPLYVLDPELCSNEDDLTTHSTPFLSPSLHGSCDTYRKKRRGGITSLSLDPNGGRLLVSSMHDRCGLHVFDPSSPERGSEMSYEAHISSFYTKASFSPDGSRIACGDTGDRIAIFRVDSPRAIAHLSGHTSEVLQVDWCPTDHHRLVSCSDDGTVLWWKLERESSDDALSCFHDPLDVPHRSRAVPRASGEGCQWIRAESDSDGEDDITEEPRGKEVEVTALAARSISTTTSEMVNETDEVGSRGCLTLSRPTPPGHSLLTRTTPAAGVGESYDALVVSFPPPVEAMFRPASPRGSTTTNGAPFSLDGVVAVTVATSPTYEATGLGDAERQRPDGSASLCSSPLPTCTHRMKSTLASRRTGPATQFPCSSSSSASSPPSSVPPFSIPSTQQRLKLRLSPQGRVTNPKEATPFHLRQTYLLSPAPTSPFSPSTRPISPIVAPLPNNSTNRTRKRLPCAQWDRNDHDGGSHMSKSSVSGGNVHAHTDRSGNGGQLGGTSNRITNYFQSLDAPSTPPSSLDGCSSV